jgi:aspyridone synthetase (hybrid polyketide synthase/nonribosomal peptide synthetase)
VQGLRHGDAELAVVAGANLILDPAMFIAESKLHMLSQDSRSRMWDKNANGYARGEGFAAMILKPLHQAIADGDDIECIIRETGVNSDGRSPKGITNPSSVAQTALIKDTYARAGLDIAKDRCQYFECHGTGTLAGDPVEAKAIQDAFFPDSSDEQSDETDPVYVGSIKTIIGHLEGCAGLAGVIKAILAVKHQIIPPNMHFHDVNPDIKPFYHHLKVATKAMPWPTTTTGVIRASVNSFGFGGTNAHAIVEAYTPSRSIESRCQSPVEENFIGPLLFSAQSPTSLLSNVEAHLKLMTDDPTLDLERLCWTLQNKRSTFAHKAVFAGSSRIQLLQSLQRFTNRDLTNGFFPDITHSTPVNPNEGPGLLGVFTGQGAQWSTMGKALIECSPLFRRVIEQCEKILSDLREGPEWSLEQEMLAEDAVSRISEAAISQPLCTALQIAMVDLLRAAGIRLNAVVGHSSGEIAAVYAAGILDKTACMQIAYYRGLYASLACGKNGGNGQMLAVGFSFDDGMTTCAEKKWVGRVVVAASNSPLSCTLSGDKDAIHELKEHLDSQKIFSRILRTDTAYHSHHMDPCAQPYLRALQGCKIQIQRPDDSCRWVSSVRGDTELLEDLSSLQDTYWVANMRSPVLFAEAITASMYNGGPYDAILEVGPHAALKGPTEQTFNACLGKAPAYCGLMGRGENEVEAFSRGVGLVWTCIGPDYIDLQGYRAAYHLSETLTPRTMKGLPPYQWDLRTRHWHESRISRHYRLRKDTYHPLLGRRVPDDANDNPRWRNILKHVELPWLQGHLFQGQMLLPGSAYLVMAIEAVKQLAPARPMSSILVEDMLISRATLTPDNASGVETVFSMVVSSTQKSGTPDDYFNTTFTCWICPMDKDSTLAKVCEGHLRVHFGASADTTLLPREDPGTPRTLVDVDRFYQSAMDLGLQYKNEFRAMKVAHRSLHSASTSASWNIAELGSEYTVHPATIDLAFQSLFLAFSSPASGDMWAPYLPTKIKRFIIDLSLERSPVQHELKVDIDACTSTTSSKLITGDVEIFQSHAISAWIQVEGLQMQAVSEPSPDDDKPLFATTSWVEDINSKLQLCDSDQSTRDDENLVDALERMSLYYWQRLLQSSSAPGSSGIAWHHEQMIRAGNAHVKRVRDGKHPVAKASWLQDSFTEVQYLFDQHQDRVDMRLIKNIGDHIESVFRGDAQLLEIMMKDDLLDRFYMEGYGISAINNAIAAAMQQITNKYPHAKILEIGAGTGGTTRKVLDTIGFSFESYTYTDISAGFFERASEKFQDYKSMVSFKVLDIEKDPQEQGFPASEYDVVIAANVLHATHSLGHTIHHVRSLLRPGGYLVLMETTGIEILRSQFIMGGLPGWWYGSDDGRVLHPGLPVLEWNDILQMNGFSGVDHELQDMHNAEKHSFSLMVSQAINSEISSLREPMSSVPSMDKSQDTIIIGGETLQTNKLVTAIAKRLRSVGRPTRLLKSLTEVNPSTITPGGSVMMLAELDQPIFKGSVTDARLEALKELMMAAKNVLWATRDRLFEPESSVSIGIIRALRNEMPHVRIQLLDVDSVDPTILTDSFLRLPIIPDQLSNETANLLWTFEPEVMVRSGVLMLPRIKPQTVLNRRCFAQRRTITDLVSPLSSCLVFSNTPEGAQLMRQEEVGFSAKPIQVKVQVLSSVNLGFTEDSPSFLSLGVIPAKKKYVLAVGQHNASRISLSECTHVTLELPEPPSSGLLGVVAGELIAISIRNRILNPGLVLLHECPDFMADTIQTGLARCSFVTRSSSRHASRNAHIVLHPNSTLRRFKQSLPAGIVCFVDFTGDAGSNLLDALPVGCLCLSYPKVVDNITPCALQEAWTSALGEASEQLNTTSLRVQDLVEGLADVSRPFIVFDWQDPSPVPAVLKSLKLDDMFRPDGTYVLLGMTGELGLSLCQWMVTCGARHLVLASRTAKVDPAAIAHMLRLGANIEIHKVDVAERISLQHMIDHVRANMPPIAGLCNASMVLADKLFMDMESKDLSDGLRAKACGTRLLDEIFHDVDLDFFILFSSLASIIGNAGQANYHAANLTMSSIAAQRRARGLAASVMHIGLITDVGYVARHGQSMEEHLRNQFFLPLSQPDIQLAFAEAILAGKTTNDTEAELILGLETFKRSEFTTRRPPWEHDPRFSHFINTKSDKNGTDMSQRSKSVDALGLLQTTQSLEKAFDVVQATFCRKLELMMKLPPDSINVDVPLIDLGCDSLLAIEIRNWFLKSLQMDVPILKILSGETVKQISTDATKHFWSSHSKAQGEKNREEARPSSVQAEHGTTDNAATDMTAQDMLKAEVGVVLDRGVSPKSVIKTNTSATTKQCSSDATSLQATNHEAPHFPLPTSDHEPEHSHDDSNIETTKCCTASPPQSRLLFLDKYLKDPTTYNVTVAYDILGEVHLPRLKRALASVVNHHSAFRTRVFEEPSTGRFLQGLLERTVTDIKIVHEGKAADADLAFEERKSEHWNLKTGQTFGITIVNVGMNHHVIIIAYHHIVMDGISLRTFLDDADMAYRLQPLQSRPGSFEYGLEQQSTNFDPASELLYWQSQFTPLPVAMPLLPMSKMDARPAISDYASHNFRQEISSEQMARIRAACQLLRARPLHFHLATLQTMLARLTLSSDICIGVVDANRSDDRYAKTIGFFMNLLPLRRACDLRSSFSEMVKAAVKAVHDSMSNSRVSFDRILHELKVPRTDTHSPLFQVAFNYRVGDLQESQLGDAKLELRRHEDARNPYDMSWSFTERKNGTCLLELAAQKSLYTKEATESIIGLYSHYLGIVSSQNHVLLKDIAVAPPDAIKEALHLGRGPVVEYDWPQSVSERFERMTELYPEDIAVRDEYGAMTYSALATLRDRIVRSLVKYAVGPGTKIAVLCQPSRHAVASFLAIMFIGCAYIPLDLRLPTNRHLAMLTGITCNMVVCESTTLPAATALRSAGDDSLQILVTDQVYETDSTIEDEVQRTPGRAEILLFTSGTTSVPKCVRLLQASFVDFMATMSHQLQIRKEVVLQQSSLGFDASLVQVLAALCNGGTLVVAPALARGDPSALSKIIRKERITYSLATPSEYGSWLECGLQDLRSSSDWKHICVGGEAVTPQLLRRFETLGRTDIQLTNWYGPTETTVAATFERLPSALTGAPHSREQNCIGKVLPNRSIYIVDEDMDILPIGFTGEICIAGAGIAHGYLGQETETTKRFILNKFTSTEDRHNGWTHLYRTGDRGRLVEDGTILFFGRMQDDSQVKLRGLRIELDEIANNILALAPDYLSQAVVTVRGNPQLLVAHVTLLSGLTMSKLQLRKLTKTLPLPQYMIPAITIALDEMPTTMNGKIDRKALEAMPLPARSASERTHSRLTMLEGQLGLLWRKILPDIDFKDQLSRDSDFFMHGGNSALLIQLQVAIRQALCVALSIAELYEASTLGEMAYRIGKHETKQETVIDWDIETHLDDAVPGAFIPPSRHVPKTTGLNILLTGPTSFLGGAVLSVLLEHEAVAKVHCIAVSAAATEALPASDKIQIYEGSLFASCLGLQEREIASLRDCIDVIIHTGSSGHCLNNFSSLRVPNVHSTRFLASLVQATCVPIHYLSSNRVALLSGSLSPRPTSVSDFPPRSDGTEGLTASKWACERLLEKLAEVSDVPIHIHRACAIIGDSAPNEDALNALLKFSLALRAVPVFDNFEGYFDFKDAALVANDIVAAAIPLDAHTRGVRYVHHSSGTKVSICQLKQKMEETHGGDFTELPVLQWMAEANRIGLEPLISTYLEAIIEKKEPIRFPYMGAK